jgi:Zn finger protein HypA/HybF (possibly regulating hydrogenase expression)
MHETRFVNEILAVLREKLDENAAQGHITVNVRLSPFSHVAPETLRESFNALNKAEKFKSLSLNILPLELPLKCNACKHSCSVTKKVFECPACGSADIDIRMDKEFFVESVEVESRD